MIQTLRITKLCNACFILLSLVLLLESACAPTQQVTPEPAALSVSIEPTSTPTITPASTPTLLPSPTPNVTPTALLLLCSPLAVQPLDKIKEIITQPFSMPRIMPDGTYKDDAHHGVDLGYYTRDGKNFTGTPVLAALNGKIASIVNNRPPYGNMIMLETPFDLIPAKFVSSHKIPVGDSLYTLYAHLQNLMPFKIGEAVVCGSQLAETGLTGFTGGPHLHFETRWGPANTIFPVMGYYRADMTPEEMKNYVLWRNSGMFRLFDPIELLAP